MSVFPQIQEFFVEGRNRKTSHVLLHISEPSTAQEIPKGSLFALIEITGGTIEQIESLQQCIDDIEAKYYNTETDNPQALFEQILEQINRKSHHLLADGTVDAVIGAMIGETILLSYHGAPIAYVCYQQKQVYKVMSIISEPEDSSSQLFSSVISGSIHLHDYFFVGTPSVGRYFSEDRIQKIITARDAQSAAMHLERVLSNLRSDISFGGVISKLISIHDLPKTGKIPPHLKQQSKHSIFDLVEAQDQTDETLNPSLLKNAKQLLSSTKDDSSSRRVSHQIDISDNENANTPFLILLLRGAGTAALTIGTIFLRIFERIAIFCRELFLFLWYLITNYKQKRAIVLRDLEQAYIQRKRAFLDLSLLSKMVLCTAILLACIFIGSIIIYSANKKQVAREQAYTLLVTDIQSAYEKAQAQFTYNDRVGALDLLVGAQTKTVNLPTHTDKQLQTKQSWLTTIATLLDQVRNITVVTPKKLATITGDSDVVPAPNHLARINNTLIAYGENDTKHYIVSTLGSTVELRDHSSLPPLLRASTPKENDTVVFLGESQSVGVLDLTNQTISSKTIIYPTAQATPNDIALYNRRAYILDAQNNQIYRHNPTGSGYDKGTPWVQTQLPNSSLHQAVSIAIDGDVFVLTKDGMIKKFVAGDEVIFSINGLDPALDAPTDIFTYTDVNFLYILEPTNKRVVVLDKTGKLIKQYTTSEWEHPTGMSVDEKNGIVYILDSNIVYSFSL